MRSWRQVSWICLLAVGCGGPLPEDPPPESASPRATAEEPAPDEVSAQWKKPLPELGPAFLLKDIYPPPEEPSPGPFGDASPTELVAFRGSLFFSAVDFAVGSAALWRSDGTTASTVPVKHIAGTPSRLTVASTRLFFTGGFSGGHENELWVSDGTEAGTLLVRDLTPASGFAFLENFVAVGDSVFFVRVVRPDIPASGHLELWRSDGTAAGTHLVKDLGPEGSAAGPFELLGVGDRLFFSNGQDASGVELWVSDGTEAGTHLVKDIVPGAGSSFPRGLTPAGGVVYFSASEPAHGRELWRSDGTAKGTVLVEDTSPGPASSETQPITVFKGCLYFATFTPGFKGTDLRKLNPDPTCHPRSKSVAFIPNPFADLPRDLFVSVFSSTVTEKKLFFTLFYDVGSPVPIDTQLWRTDGTREGTKLLHRPLVLSEGLLPATPAPTDDGRVVFFGFDTEHGHEPWVSDGFPSGTRLLQDIVPGPGSSYPQDMLRAGDVIYFTAKDAEHGREIWALPVPHAGGTGPAAGR